MKVPPELAAALDATGLPWEVEIGKKHRKIRLAGRLVTVIPHGPKQEANKRVVFNTIKNVRHMEKTIKEGK